MCTNTSSCCVYTVSCFELKTEACSDDDIIEECLHDDKPTIGTLCLSLFCLLCTSSHCLCHIFQ